MKAKTRIPKLAFYYYARVLAFYYYARVHERFVGNWGIARREAAMSLKFRPKLDKIVELLLYLAHKRPGADKYQAVKFFYLADREHFKRYGRPITFENYYALWYGPVAENALDLLNKKYWTLHRAGLKDLPFRTEIGKVTTKSGKETETTFIREPLREVKDDLFSKSDLEVFDEIIAKYGKASFEELFDLTHEHFAYVNAWKNRREGNHAQMFYDEMIDDEARRAEIIDDMSPVAVHMK